MGNDLTRVAVTESRIDTSREQVECLFKGTLKPGSGKRIEVNRSVRTFPTRLPITDIDCRPTERGALDQSCTAVTNQYIDAFEESDEIPPLKVGQREQIGFPDRIADSITTGIEIWREQ